MDNKLCTVCIHPCKQTDTVSIRSCPRFVRKPDDREFRRMVDDLDRTEANARALQKQVRDLIVTVLESPTKDHRKPGAEVSEDAEDVDG